MLYVASAQPATAQLSALSCDFLTPGTKSLIINKLTRIEVWELREDEEGLKMVLEIPVWGAVAAMQAVKLQGQSTSSLVVLTASLHLFALTYSPTAPHILTTSTTSILELHGRLSSLQAILVDPTQRCLLVHAYNGLVRVIPLAPPKPSKRNQLASPALDLSRGYNVRLPSLNITSLAFLPPAVEAEGLSFLAMVYSDHLGRRILEVRELDLEEKELVEDGVEVVLEDPGSEIVIPVVGEGAQGRGVVVVGEESLVWAGIGGQKGKAKEAKVKCAIPVGNIQAWTKLDGGEDRFLLGDIYGKLIVLEIVRGSAGNVVDLVATDLGDTSSPTSIVHLSPSLIYLSSRFADSQLVRLPSNLSSSQDKDRMDVEEDDSLALVATFASLSPILDCCVVEAEGGGASHVVTCSGAYKGGSLRVVRQGVGLSELANLEMENIQRMWSMRRESSSDELLVLSSFNETRILSFSSSEGAEDEIEEIDLPAFIAETATLLACHLGSLFAQVTASGIGYSDGTTANVGRWTPEGGKKITLAVTDGARIVLAVEGGVIVLLAEQAGGLVQVGSTQLANEIACLDLATVGSETLAAVGLWTAQTVLLISIPTLATISSQILDTNYLIRSVLLTTFSDGITHLFTGLGDGSLTSFVVEKASGSIVESTRKTVTLGTRPIVMCAFTAKGSTSVFVSSDRPTVISRAGDKLVYSSVNLKNINAVVAFNSSAYPSALALASPTELRIGRIEDIQRVDIRAIPLEEDEPRRIAHDPVGKAYGVACLRRDVNRVTGEQATLGSVKMFDDQSFEVLADIPLEPQEEGQSIAVLSVGGVKKFVVGTAYVLPTEQEPTKGRILIFSEAADRTFEMTSSQVVSGCPYALATLADGFLAAAVNSQVEVFSVDASTLALTPAASWGGSFISLNLVSCADNTLLVGDALRSVTLLKFTPSPPKLEEVARDYSARYMSAVESLVGTTEYIGAETDLNLFTVQKENVTNTRSMVEEHALAPRGMFHLGEMVSKFAHGSLVQQFGDNAGVASPRLIFTTSAGSLGVIVELDAASSKVLSDLERNMRQVVKGVGELKQEDWRSFKSERTIAPPAGFVDGDFVELFAELSKEEIDAVMEGGSEHEKLTASREELLKLVEELMRMH